MYKPDFIYDKRLIERMIKRGVIARADLETHLEGLPDVTEKSEPLVTEDEGVSGSDDSDTPEAS